jgi:predicted nucleic acid-binding protein
VLIPRAVYDEVVAGTAQPGEEEVQTLEWMESLQVVNYDLVVALRTELDQGEAEAIALSIEKQADLLLIDERRGRRVAFRLGLRPLGLLGLLIDAKQQNYVSSVKPILDDLIMKAGFWVDRELYSRVLDVAGE